MAFPHCATITVIPNEKHKEIKIEQIVNLDTFEKMWSFNNCFYIKFSFSKCIIEITEQSYLDLKKILRGWE